mgnify:CR=1 FL=1
MNVLLTDDDPQLLAGVQRVFERRGHAVDTCSTGTEALALLDKKTYALLVLDWGLPDVDGVDVVARLRERGRTLPVLMLTGRNTSEDLVRALDAGADDFITKADAKVDVLLARAEALMRRANYPAAPRRIEAGSIVLDEGTKTASLNGTPIDLAPSELRALAILASQMGKVVSRAELCAGCWGEGVEVSDNALESIVKRLRKKLGEDANRLQSVRLRGYVLVAPTG